MPLREIGNRTNQLHHLPTLLLMTAYDTLVRATMLPDSMMLTPAFSTSPKGRRVSDIEYVGQGIIVYLMSFAVRRRWEEPLVHTENHRDGCYARGTVYLVQPRQLFPLSPSATTKLSKQHCAEGL